jgi:hypothetical protein
MCPRTEETLEFPSYALQAVPRHAGRIITKSCQRVDSRQASGCLGLWSNQIKKQNGFLPVKDTSAGHFRGRNNVSLQLFPAEPVCIASRSSRKHIPLLIPAPRTHLGRGHGRFGINLLVCGRMLSKQRPMRQGFQGTCFVFKILLSHR